MEFPEPNIPAKKRVVPPIPEDRLRKIKLDSGTFQGEKVTVAYKVVTGEMRSLGLRHNPNLLTYPKGEWCEMPDKWIEDGGTDWGGFWVSRTKSGAKGLRKYVFEMHGIKARIFKAYLGNLLFYNTYRIKTDKIYLSRELFIK
ncbi:MAG: hypothetical protein ACT6FG_00305 [Methanosarcinaceae archaeon]